MNNPPWETVGADASAFAALPDLHPFVTVSGVRPAWKYAIRGTIPPEMQSEGVQWTTTPEGLLLAALWQQDGTTATLAALLRRIADHLDAQAPT